MTNADLIRYAGLSKFAKGESFKNLKISAYIPTPDEIDYKRGYISRYFVQRANDMSGKITEINEIAFSKFVNTPFYTAITLDWKITGDDAEIKDCNFKSIKFILKQMPKIQMYLPNLLQFRKIEATQ
jgi:hypothetical protein